MRFNGHKGEIDDNDFQKNKKLKEAYAFIADSLKKDYNFDKQIVVGTIKVDEHSRLTLSKKIKNVFPIYPGDTIVVYQDLISNNLLFKVQRLNEVSDTWIIKRQYNDAASSFSSDNNNVIFYDKSVSTNNYHNGENVQQLVEHTFNIMIVDDNSDILDFYKDFFLFSIGSKNDEKYFIETFSSAAEALKRFVDVYINNKSFSYDLILIDIKMPDISGLQLYQLIKIIDMNVKILFISALDKAEEFEGVLPGITSKDIIKKPFQSEHFISTIKEKLK